MPRKKMSVDEELAAAEQRVTELKAKKAEEDQRARAAQVDIVGEAVLAEIDRGGVQGDVQAWLHELIAKLPARKREKVSSLLPPLSRPPEAGQPHG